MDSTKIRELCLGNNISYVLSVSAGFSPAAYRCARSGRELFVPLMKMELNGDNLMFFRVEHLARLDYYLQILSKEGYLKMQADLSKALRSVLSDKKFLFENYILKPDRIYVDSGNGNVKFLYIPAAEPVFEDNAAKLMELCNIVMDSARPEWRTDPLAKKGFSILREMSCSINDTSIRARQNGATIEKSFTGRDSGNKSMRIIGTGSADGIVFCIRDPIFVIGRSGQLSNGVIDGNQAVSRSHCKIESRNGKSFITDLNSKYGTFVNGQRVTDHQVEIKNKDQIRIANYDFIVEITE